MLIYNSLLLQLERKYAFNLSTLQYAISLRNKGFRWTHNICTMRLEIVFNERENRCNLKSKSHGS